MTRTTEEKKNVVIKFAGDSGDGMQLVGTQFSNNTALIGNDLGTFPDFPAEIRAPQGTVAGVSGFQIHFGSEQIFTPGDTFDVLVAMNAAALKSNLEHVRKGGTLIVNTAGFDKKNLKLAKYESSPLDTPMLEGYEVHQIDVTKLTKEALVDIDITPKFKERSKNMFVLGFIYWMYNRSLDSSIKFLESKFGKKPEVLEANIKAIKTGYNYGEITETFRTRYKVAPAKMAEGTYRSIMGNHALALGLITASQKSNLELFYGTYPITPATDILHELAKHKNFGVKTFQAEDEIAGICSAIGASYGGALGVTGSSGPGIALKGEAIGLAVMLELPLVIVNVQRAGPSTGLPTKTEQADLLQAVYGRNGECPMPVFAAATPSDCFNMAFETSRIALQHMTPVMLLTDGYIANGTEPWRFPTSADIDEIEVKHKERLEEGEEFLPYKRDEKLVRSWAIPGTKGLEHRIGGLEKDGETGNVSYDPENHQRMVKIRQAKIDKISEFIPKQAIEVGVEKGKILVLGWGSTFGSIKFAVNELLQEGYEVAHAHLRYIVPFPSNLQEILESYDKVIIPEINNGQLIKLIRDKYLIPAIGYNKIKGTPITKDELKDFILEHLNA